MNNAAAAMYDQLAAFPLKRRRILFEANVHAPLDLAQAAIPAMRDAGEGWIVNVSSGTARRRRSTVRAGLHRVDHRRLRRVEGGVEPDHEWSRRRAARHRHPGERGSSPEPPC